MPKGTAIKFFQQHIVQKKKTFQLDEDVATDIMAGKMPFTEKKYYSFCDKYLDDDAEEDLYLDEVNKYFREIATDYDTLKYFLFLKQFYDDPVFCDIGCGIGNVLYFTEKMGFRSFGYEINQELKPIHQKIKVDIAYGDLTILSLSRLRTADVIYLYRPVNDKGIMNRLFDKIHEQTKQDVLILYNYPHTRTIKGFDAVTLNQYDDHIILLMKSSG